MKYQITSDNIEISESMKHLAKEKMAKIEHHVKNAPPEASSCRVVMNTAPDNMFTIKIELDLNGKMFFTDETGPVLETTLISAVEELDRQIEKKLTGKHEKNWEEKRESKRLQPTDLEDEGA